MKLEKVVFVGCHEVGYSLLNLLLQEGVNFSHIVTLTAKKAKQQNVSGFKDFRPLAVKFNIPVYYAEKYSLKSESDQLFFKTNKFTLLIQGGWQRLFPDSILNTIKIGAIGVHGSAEFLPFGRGRSPINWSIIEGKKRFIFHYFLIKSGIDDGDVFCTRMVDINEWDDCKTLYEKNSIVTAQVLIEFLPILNSGIYTLNPQEGNPTYYPKRTVEMGAIDLSKDIFQIHNFVKALTRPYPGAFLFHDQKVVLIWKCQPFDTRIDLANTPIGAVVFIFEVGRVVVKVIGGLLLITEYEYERKLVVGDILTGKNELSR